MRILGVIPARYASTRFPGKPLIEIAGKTMIQRVYEQAKKCRLLETLYVATDNESIFNHVKAFGGNVLMTSENHRSGTERCNEVSEFLFGQGHPYDAVINIQGDEPFIEPDQITEVAAAFSDGKAEIVTLIRKITNEEDVADPNVVKVVTTADGNALYFSRSSIPNTRGKVQGEWLQHTCYYEHVGIYGYTCPVLSLITKLPPSLLEKAESLEQLRWLENGLSIRTLLTDHESISIDTPLDLLKITNRT